MNREVQVRFCERLEGKFLGPTRHQSGVKASRPALDKMMKSVRAREIDRVIVYSFSRYARSTSHLLAALEEFKKLGVEFVSISENIETNSPLGVAIFALTGGSMPKFSGTRF
jgi:DNA invertase Pin-like site-specific DNA recombinase